MPLDLATYQAAVERDLLRLLPSGEPPEFPPVTGRPELYVEGSSRTWHELHETGQAHAAGARDNYEQEAVERHWQDWERWRDERLAEWPELVTPGVWAPGDLDWWAAWWRRLPAEEQARWQRRLGADEAWWRAVEDGEREWWSRRDREQEHWVTSLIESSRARRPRGFLGRLGAPDDAWHDWLEAEAGARQRELDRTWADHRTWTASKVRTEGLRTQWLGAVREDALVQLRELGPLAGSTEEYRYWEARLSAPGAGLTAADWQAVQSYWAATALAAGQRALAVPAVQERLCPALQEVAGDARAICRVVGPGLASLAAAGTRALSLAPALAAPAVAAAASVAIAQVGVAAWCGGAAQG